MPAFLVHGVPDTPHLWDLIRSHLKRDDIIAPNLPGFAAPVADGFGSTMDEYVSWLIARIEEVGEPVDLVGHDWGSLLSQRIVSLRPDLIRTWAVGAAALDETYVWHDMAKAWQTAGVGEQVMKGFTPDAMAAALSQQGVEEVAARETASRIDETMKASILALYRSAVNVGTDWPALANRDLPGLVIWGGDDPYVASSFAARLGERTGAKVVVLEGCAHSSSSSGRPRWRRCWKSCGRGSWRPRFERSAGTKESQRSDGLDSSPRARNDNSRGLA